MKYFFNTIKTYSYWRYALFSSEGIFRFFGFLGALYLMVEMLDFFGVVTRDKYFKYGILFLVGPSLAFALYTRRPITQITYKIPKKDLRIEIVIGNLLKSDCPNIVISSSTTFDTDMAKGLISPNSLQGQLANQYFSGNTGEIDKQLIKSLEKESGKKFPAGVGKKIRYKMGTTAKINGHGKAFYFVAMSEFNKAGNAFSTIQNIDTALESLWKYIANNAELGDVAIAVMGTGRGRVQIARKKMIAKIADSFAEASQERIFANRLAIYIHPEDAEKYNMSLFEIRDYVVHGLHI